MNSHCRIKTLTAFLFLWAIFFVLGAFSTLAQTALPDAHITSDSTWKYSRTEEAWWHSLGFDDSRWGFAVVPSNGLCDPLMKPIPHIAAPMWAPNPQQGEAVYFRKKFNLREKPEKAVIQTVFDDDGDVYVNGTLVRRDRSGSVNEQVFENDVTTLLKDGENVVGLFAIDTRGVCQSAQVRVDLELTYEDVILDVPLMKQTNPLWKGDVYAGGEKDKLDCGTNLEDCGCTTTSLAMILRYFGATKSPDGQETTPQSVNSYFKKGQKCGSQGCISLGYVYGALRWAAAEQYTKEAHDRYGTQKVEWIDRVAANPEDIKAEINNTHPVALRVGDENHWVVGYGITKNDIVIRDPYFERTLLSDPAYGSKAAAMARFKKTNSDFRLVQVASPANQRILIVDSRGRRTGYDSQRQQIVKEIPNSSYDFEPATLGVGGGEQANTSRGAWIITVKLPETEEYNLNIDPANQQDTYEVGVYASNKDAVLNYELKQGKISASNVVPELVIQYNQDAEADILHTRKYEKSQKKKQRSCIRTRSIASTVIYSSPTFNVLDIDFRSVKLSGAPLTRMRSKDLNKDGKQDIILSFRLNETELRCDSARATLTGKKVSGEAFRRAYDLRFEGKGRSVMVGGILNPNDS